MKIDYASDLHLEFGVPQSELDVLDGGELLILAGDIVDGKLRGLNELAILSTRYDNVLMVMGNHEHYKGKFGLTEQKLKEVLPSNVQLLENEIVVINGKRFLGCTMWSYMDEVDQYFAKVRMNDYKVVRSGPPGKPWLRKLIPSETVSKWIESTMWLENNVIEGDIVITHHAPSFKSCNPDYVGNTAYASDLSDIILDNKPSFWIHGHLHEPVNYMIGDTTIVSNPYGYYPNNNKFYNRTIECKNF